jgi:hypothetical protein
VLDFNESKRILTYEAQIATGEIPVFYTRQFINTQPVFFQLEKVFPYALGWPSFLLGLAGAGAALAFLLKAVLGKKKEVFYCRLFLVFSAFFLYFLSQAFLFCKWTRFMAPIFPFFPLFGAFFLEKISRSRKFRLSEGFKKGFFSLLTLILITPGVIFSSIYFRPDIRFAASSWIYENLPAGAKILLEAGNVIDLPIVPPNFKSTRTNYQSLSFDFYHLDENPSLLPKLLSALENSGYIIVPSRRIFGNHLRLQQDYPLTAKYHQLLFSGELGFRLIKEMAVFPSFLSDEGAEETWSVFDHPKIRIYQKDRPMTAKDYETLFEKN